MWTNPIGGITGGAITQWNAVQMRLRATRLDFKFLLIAIEGIDQPIYRAWCGPGQELSMLLLI